MKASPKTQLGLLAGIVAVSALILFAQTRWTPGGNWGFPEDLSAEGYRIDRLIIVTGAFVTFMFIITCAWMAYACLRHARNHEAEYDHGNASSSVMTALVLSGVIFFVVDGNLFVNSVVDTGEVFWNYAKPQSDPQTVRIEVNARQWAWDARYAGPDGEFNTADDVLTLNDIRVPRDRPVHVQIAATDVIHSFYLPHLRVKIDAVPGQMNQTWFQAARTGKVEIACAQHCGMAHYLMRGELTILEPADFDAWVAQASAVSSLAYDPDDVAAHWGWAWQEI